MTAATTALVARLHNAPVPAEFAELLDEAAAAIEALQADAERLDYLEREKAIEEKYLRDLSRDDRPLALFRRNMPITRAAIDAARKATP